MQKPKRVSLKSQIEALKPFDCEEQIDKLIGLMTERNSSIDCYLDKWICSLMESPSLVDYFKEKSTSLKHIEPATDTMPYLADLLVKYYPVDNASKVDKLYDELTESGNLLSRRDFDFASGKILGKGKQQWQKRYDEGREIKLEVVNIPPNKIISVPQPLASLLVTGSVKEIKIENYYTLHEGDTIYIHADEYSPEMMNKIKYNLDIWSNFCNGIFTGSYQDEHFPGNCYLGKIVVGEKISKGVEQVVNPTVFDSPISSQINCAPSKLLVPSHHFKMNHIEISGRTIIAPVNDETWNQIEKLEGDTFFYWEEGFDKIIRFKSIDEYRLEIWDDDDEEENDHNSFMEGIAGDEQGLYEILFVNGQKQKLYKQISERAVRSELYMTNAGDYFKALVFDFEYIIAANDKESSFDILQKKEWVLDWNCVRFKNGIMIVSAPLDGSVRFKPKEVHLPGAIEAYNYLTSYLSDRLAPIHCSVEKMELTIYDTIRLNEAIQKFATASRQKGISITGNTSLNRISVPQQMSFNQALSKAKQMTADEFEKYKSEYIDYLVKQQSKKYKVIPCVERLAYRDSDTMEYAFMFSIQCKSGDILIVHENVHPDRSTLLFVVKQENYDQAIRSVYDFLQGAEINKRSCLRDRNIDIKQSGVEHYRSINHDYFYSWSKVIKNYKSFYENGHVWMIY